MSWALEDLLKKYREQALEQLHEKPLKTRTSQQSSTTEPLTAFEVTLPIDLTNGNEGRTKHYGKSAAARKQFERIVRSLGHVRTPLDQPVRVTVTRVLGKNQRMFDPSSLGRGNYKELEDALTACGWWHDDSSKWISSVVFRQDAGRRGVGPAVVVRVEVAGVAGLEAQ